jgi:cysteine desulfurase
MSVYLDHAATTPMCDVAIDAMSAALSKLGNPSSLHTQGRAARKDVEDAREKIARAVHCQASEVIFTGSGTEANNAAIKGLYWNSPKKVIVVSSIEHHAVLDPALWLVEHEGAELIQIPVTGDGVVDLDFLRALVAARSAEIALISVMHSNNETGVIQPIAEVVKIAGDIPVHSDVAEFYEGATELLTTWSLCYDH